MRIKSKTKARGLQFYKKLDKNSVRSANNLPQGVYRRPSTEHIPSLIVSSVPNENTLAKNTVIERVYRGEIVGKEADEIIRKSKCLAPAYNKGAYQYIDTKEQAIDIGRNTSIKGHNS